MAMERPDVEASCVSSQYSDGEYDDEDEEAENQLQRAARAGILLLEKNHELLNETKALRLQVKALQVERPVLDEELQKKDNELELLREERKQTLLEVNALRSQLRAQALVVMDLMDRDQKLKEEKNASDDARHLAEYQFSRLQTEMEELHLQNKKASNDLSGGSHGGSGSKSEISIANPAATYDSNQSSTFTLAEHEELQQKWQRTLRENDTLHLELKSLRKDLDLMKRKTSKMSELQLFSERLEKKLVKLAYDNDVLQKDYKEEQALSASRQAMVATYKQIADARPFSGDCTCVLHPEDTQRNELGVSIQDQLIETNLQLEKQVRELRTRLSGGGEKNGQDGEQEDEDDAENDTQTSDGSAEAESNNHMITTELEEEDDEEEHEADNREHVEMETSDSGSGGLPLAGVGTPTATSSSGGGGNNVNVDFETKKVQELQEKNSALKDSLRHTKQQWHVAIASQKALEECNRAAQAEITRLTQLVDYQVASLTHGPTHHHHQIEPSNNCSEETLLVAGASPRATAGGAGGRTPHGIDQDDDDARWVEETAPYPAPPGDLNSPLIKCLLDHWTTDKSKVMHLTDWLHHAIRGTGKPRPLRLEHLTSEVTAGFTQLLVPILRERHGVSVTIYRRESVQILTDMVFQAHQPRQPPESPSFFSTIAAKLTEAMALTPPPTPPLSAAPAPSSEIGRIRMTRSTSNGSASSSESGSASAGGKARRLRPGPESSTVMSEAHFLYG